MTQDGSKKTVTVEDYADWFEAVNSGYENMVREMAEANPHILEVTDYDGATALLLTAAQGKGKMAALLLRLGAKVDAADEQGATALTTAAAKGDTVIMQMLIDRGAQLETRFGDDIRTPLHLAAYNGETEAVRLLVGSGADVQAKDGHGKTALQLALSKRRTGTAQCLEREMARVSFAEEAKMLTEGLSKPLNVKHQIELKQPRPQGPPGHG